MNIFVGAHLGLMTLYEFYSRYSTFTEYGIITLLLIYYRKKFNQQEKHIIIWFAISSIVGTVARLLWLKHAHNGWWYNLTNFFQWGYPGYFYYKYTNSVKTKNIILISFIAVIIFSIVQLSVVGLLYIDGYSVILFNLVNGVFAYFFLKQLFEEVNTNPIHTLAFWFCFPAMIDAMCTIPCYAMFPMVIKNVLLTAFYYITDFSFTFWHVVFMIGIIYTQTVRKKQDRIQKAENNGK